MVLYILSILSHGDVLFLNWPKVVKQHKENGQNVNGQNGCL